MRDYAISRTSHLNPGENSTHFLKRREGVIQMDFSPSGGTAEFDITNIINIQERGQIMPESTLDKVENGTLKVPGFFPDSPPALTIIHWYNEFTACFTRHPQPMIEELRLL